MNTIPHGSVPQGLNNIPDNVYRKRYVAKELVNKFGIELIGKAILTQQEGCWPGGPAEIIDIYPIAGDANIVLMVRNHLGEIGVFGTEECHLIIRKYPMKKKIKPMTQKLYDLRRKRLFED